MYYIIVNPCAKSGKSAHQWKKLKAALDRAKITYIVHHTKSAQDVTSYTAKITDKNLYEQTPTIHRIIVLGGDGTLNCVINGIDDMEHTQLVYLPAGTSNDFAKALQLTDDPEKVLETLSSSNVLRSCDLGVAKLGHKTKRFQVSCGIGYDAAICAQVNATSAKTILNRLHLGKLIYVAVALKQLRRLQPVSCDIYLDDQKPIHISSFYFATCMEQPYEGGGFKFCPHADDRDGLIDICAVGDISKWYALSLFPLAAKGRHIGRHGVHYLRCKKARIVTDKPLFVHTDGEVIGTYSEISVSTHENALSYCITT